MRIPAAAPVAALVLAGCVGPPPPPPGEGGIPYLVTTARVIGPEALYVEAEAAHRSRLHRLERITLVDPAGREHAAIDVRADVVRTAPPGYAPAGAIGVGVASGYRSSVGVGFAFPLVVSEGRPLFRMRATFRVPQPARYRRDPYAWTIRLHFTTRPGAQVIVDRPAPLPGS